jgi:hypothetical protein
MLILNMARLLPLAAALMLSPACDGPQSLVESSAKAEARAVEGHRPAFTAETVVKLNAVVAKSKATLERFDKVRAELAAARKAKDAARTAPLEAELATLKGSAEQAAASFQTEKQALLSRDEVYDPIVLGAMEQFVMDAPGEIAAALPTRRGER